MCDHVQHFNGDFLGTRKKTPFFIDFRKIRKGLPRFTDMSVKCKSIYANLV